MHSTSLNSTGCVPFDEPQSARGLTLARTPTTTRTRRRRPMFAAMILARRNGNARIVLQRSTGISRAHRIAERSTSFPLIGKEGDRGCSLRQTRRITMRLIIAELASIFFRLYHRANHEGHRCHHTKSTARTAMRGRPRSLLSSHLLLPPLK